MQSREAPSGGDCEPAEAVKKSSNPILSTICNLAVISCGLTKRMFCFMLFFFLVYFLPPFLPPPTPASSPPPTPPASSLSPSLLPSLSENSEWNSGRVHHFPRVFPLHPAAHLCFTPIPPSPGIPPRNENSLHCTYLQVSSHIWAPHRPIKLWSDRGSPSIAIQQVLKKISRGLSLLLRISGLACPLTSRVAQNIPCHTVAATICLETYTALILKPCTGK